MSLSSLFVVTNALRLKRFSFGYEQNHQKTVQKDVDTESLIHTKRQGDGNMTKVVLIEGMTCMHCQKRVEQALHAIEHVQATVDLEKNQAMVQSSEDISDDILRQAVTDAGYTVTDIKEL
jgi:copper chaperone CopZ